MRLRKSRRAILTCVVRSWPVGLGLLAVACTAGLVPLKTYPATGVCDTASRRGTLVTDSASGVALEPSPSGHLTLLWPEGWSDRVNGDRIEVVDIGGSVVARVGDNVAISGGLGQDGTWAVCGSVRVFGSGAASPGT
jgi:hypothetical protein